MYNPATLHLYRLLAEARALRYRLENLPYGGRLIPIYHAALRREFRRHSKFIVATVQNLDGWPGL